MKLKVIIQILVVLKIMVIPINSASAKETNIFILRGLIRENAHSQFFFDSLKKQFPEINFYGLEVRGNGKYFQEPSPTSIPTMVEQIRNDYLEANKNKDADNYLIAISLGGMVGIAWMDKYADDFKKAVILNSSLKGHCPIYYRMLPKNLPKYAKFIFANDPKKKEEIIYSMIISDQERHRYLIDHWVDIRKKRPVSLSNTIRQMFAAATYNPPKTAPNVPITIGVSYGDDFVSPKCSENIAKNWKLPLVTHPSGGHDITNDKPEWIMQLIQDHFLKNNSLSKN